MNKHAIKKQSFMNTTFQKFYVPTLMNKYIRPLVMLLFTAWLCTSIIVIPKIDIGLDVELTMPDDSYVLKYFKVQYNLLLYFIVYDYKTDYQIFIVYIVYETLPFDWSSGLFCRNRRVKLD